MRRCLSSFFVLCLIVGTEHLAEAKQRFSLYEGPDSIKVGRGGTRIEKNGIQYWLQGAPNRPFKVLGIFDDTRKDRWWDGDAIGSKSIAKQVLKVGASAVIVLNQDTRISSIETISSASFSGDSSFSGTSSSYSSSNWTNGSFSGSGTYSGNGFGISSTFAINSTTTRLLVVRYLTDQELADLKAASGDAQASDGVLPSALQSSQASPANPGYRVVSDTPQKRPAKTPSGFCYDVPRDYRGAGSLSRPALSTSTPACWQLEAGGPD